MGSKTIIGIVGLTVVSIFMMFRLIQSSEEPTRVLPKPTLVADTVKIDTFSEANLILYMHELKIKAPNIVLAQAKLETGNFSSYLFEVSNNLFGFRGFRGYYKYENWQSSVVAYKEWQDKKYKGGDYFEFLESIGYATDSLYCYKLKQF